MAEQVNCKNKHVNYHLCLKITKFSMIMICYELCNGFQISQLAEEGIQHHLKWATNNTQAKISDIFTQQ